MIRFATLLFALSIFGSASAQETDLKIIVIVGAGGTDEYEEEFAKTALVWSEAAERGGARFELIGGEVDSDNDAKVLQESLANTDARELWLILIGHGSYDGRVAKFNARGPDFTGEDLAGWLEKYKGELVVINTASASGSFIEDLAKPERIVITATKNEAEISYTRFGKYFAEAIAGKPEADLDNDDQVSLLEGFLFSADRVAKFYEAENRIATEHALIDDDGDALGSRSEWFVGVNATQAPTKEAEFDGERAAQKVLIKNAFERQLTNEQRKSRDNLELKVKDLRRNKADFDEDDYYSQLEALLLELATIYRDVGKS